LAAAAALQIAESVEAGLARLDDRVIRCADRAVIPGLAYVTLIDAVGLIHDAVALMAAHMAS
jgi:hypothetical protein